MPKILEILVGSKMGRSVSVHADQNIWENGPLEITHFDRFDRSNQNLPLYYVGNSEKGMEMVRLFFLVGPIRVENAVTFSVGTVVTY